MRNQIHLNDISGNGETKVRGYLGAISPRVSNAPNSGHYSTFYSAIHKFNRSQGNKHPSTIGPEKVSCDYVEPVLPSKVRGDEFRLHIRYLLGPKFRALCEAISNREATGYRRYIVYDGGLAELALLTRLARRFPNLSFIFNFHWADQWLEIFGAKSILGKLLKRSLVNMVRVLPRGLILTAESTRLSSEISSILNKSISVVPIFSAFCDRETQPWKFRPLDVLLLPQRRDELQFCREISDKLLSDSYTVGIGLNQYLLSNYEMSGDENPCLVKVALPLEDEDYVSLFGSAKVIVLPYDKPYFLWGSSGKFADSIALGCLPLAPRGSAITSQSGSNPKNHEFDMTKTTQAAKDVKAALRRGTPDLHKTSVEDFCNWALNLDLHETDKNQRFGGLRIAAFYFWALIWGFALVWLGSWKKARNFSSRLWVIAGKILRNQRGDLRGEIF